MPVWVWLSFFITFVSYLLNAIPSLLFNYNLIVINNKIFRLRADATDCNKSVKAKISVYKGLFNGIQGPL